MEALQEEIEKLEEETKGKDLLGNEITEEESQEEPVEDAEDEDQVIEGEEPKPQEEEEAPVVAESEEDEDAKAKAAQEAYRERQKAKKEEQQRKAAEAKAQQERLELLKQQQEPSSVDEQQLLKQKLNQIDQILYKQRVEEWTNSAERELASLESEFKVAFTDYDDAVSQALEITKDRMINSGMTEREASEVLRLEKLKIADAAAAKGLDPVEAVYKEAQSINTWFEQQAQKLGYVKSGNAKKPQTQKAALREASKPNAVTSGRGASSIKFSYDEMDDVSDVSIGDLLSGKIQ